LVALYAWMAGAYIAWVSLFDTMLSRGSVYSERFIGLLSFCSNLGYIAGGLVSGWLVDKWFRRRHRAVLYCACIASAVLSLVFTLSLPSSSSALPVGLHGGRHLLLLAVASGFPNGMIDPIVYELAAELTFPVSEGSSAALLALGENFGSIFLLQLLARYASPESLSCVFLLGLWCCVFLVKLIHPRYHRSAAEKTALQTKSAPGSPIMPTDHHTFSDQASPSDGFGSPFLVSTPTLPRPSPDK
jgi:MFS family permease